LRLGHLAGSFPPGALALMRSPLATTSTWNCQPSSEVVGLVGTPLRCR